MAFSRHPVPEVSAVPPTGCGITSERVTPRLVGTATPAKCQKSLWMERGRQRRRLAADSRETRRASPACRAGFTGDR